MLRGVLSAGRAILRATVVVVLVAIVALEGTVFAFALYTQVIGADGHFRGGLVGFAVHLTLLLLALAGLRTLARSREAVQTA